MVNKLSENGIAIASAALTAIAYIICFVIVLVLPSETALRFFNLFFHGIDLTSLATTPNIISGIIGLIISVIVAYVYGWIFALVYNKFAK